MPTSINNGGGSDYWNATRLRNAGTNMPGVNLPGLPGSGSSGGSSGAGSRPGIAPPRVGINLPHGDPPKDIGIRRRKKPGKHQTKPIKPGTKNPPRGNIPVVTNKLPKVETPHGVNPVETIKLIDPLSYGVSANGARDMAALPPANYVLKGGVYPTNVPLAGMSFNGGQHPGAWTISGPHQASPPVRLWNRDSGGNTNGGNMLAGLFSKISAFMKR